MHVVLNGHDAAPVLRRSSRLAEEKGIKLRSNPALAMSVPTAALVRMSSPPQVLASASRIEHRHLEWQPRGLPVAIALRPK